MTTPRRPRTPARRLEEIARQLAPPPPTPAPPPPTARRTRRQRRAAYEIINAPDLPRPRRTP